MDNLSVHQAQLIQDVIECVGAQQVFLPPYSPDLSPIELCWSKLYEWRAYRTHLELTLALNKRLNADCYLANLL